MFNFYLKTRNYITGIIITLVIFLFVLMFALSYSGVFIPELIIGIFFTISFFVISYIFIRVYNKVEHEEIYKELQEFIFSQNPNVKLYIEKSSDYNGGAYSDKCICITSKWYAHAKEHGSKIAKATICHELYHISKKHPILDFSRLKKICPIKTIRDNYYINLWKEEFEADRYGLLLLGDEVAFLDNMTIMQEQRLKKEEEKNKRRKWRKKKKPEVCTHPTWEMRIRFIKDGTEPSEANVAKEYYEYYKK